MCHESASWLKFPLFTGIWRTSKRGIQCLFWWHCLPVFILSEAYYHNSEVIQDISQLIGYHDNQSGYTPPDALYPVAQHCPAFHAWEYWESVWDARQWWEDSSAVQTWMDVESILSARGIHRKWPSICRQGNVSKHIVCGLIIEGLACWSSVWCNWLKTNGLPEIWLLQAQLTGAIRSTASAQEPLPLPPVLHSSFEQYFLIKLFVQWKTYYHI